MVLILFLYIESSPKLLFILEVLTLLSTLPLVFNELFVFSIFWLVLGVYLKENLTYLFGNSTN